MSVTVAAYRHNAFSELPDLSSANRDLQAQGGRAMIYDALGPLFIKYGMEEK